MIDRDRVTRILDLAAEPRPANWIVRETGYSRKDVNAVLKVAGVSVGGADLDLSKYDWLEKMVEDGASIQEIRRTLGVDPRTVRRWFPGYRVGMVGHSAESKVLAEFIRRFG